MRNNDQVLYVELVCKVGFENRGLKLTGTIIYKYFIGSTPKLVQHSFAVAHFIGRMFVQAE